MNIALLGLVLIVGMLLVAVEVFLVPGFSVPGIIGMVLMGYGVYRANVLFGMTGVFVAVSASILGTVVLAVIAVKSGSMKSITLAERQKGTTATDDLSSLLGKTGEALSTLRPAGTAVIDGNRVDVVTDGEFIEAGSTIKVLSVQGSRIIVTMDERR